MKTSQLIRELAEVIEKYGDLPAFYFDGACTHEPAVIATLHRTGNSTWIWEYITDTEVDAIMKAASAEEIDRAYSSGAKRRHIAALIKSTTPAPFDERYESLLITLRDILTEANNTAADGFDRCERIAKLTSDVLSKAEGRNA